LQGLDFRGDWHASRLLEPVALRSPPIDLVFEGIHRVLSRMAVAGYRQLVGSSPALNGANRRVEVIRDFLPGVEPVTARSIHKAALRLVDHIHRSGRKGKALLTNDNARQSPTRSLWRLINR